MESIDLGIFPDLVEPPKPNWKPLVVAVTFIAVLVAAVFLMIVMDDETTPPTMRTELRVGDYYVQDGYNYERDPEEQHYMIRMEIVSIDGDVCDVMVTDEESTYLDKLTKYEFLSNLRADDVWLAFHNKYAGTVELETSWGTVPCKEFQDVHPKNPISIFVGPDMTIYEFRSSEYRLILKETSLFEP